MEQVEQGVCKGCGWLAEVNDNGFCVYCQDLIDFEQYIGNIEGVYE